MLSAISQNKVPIYIYKCHKCSVCLKKRHSIKEKLTDCEVCKAKDALIRVPPNVSASKKDRPHKPGDLVNDCIEKSREELTQQREDLKRKRE